MSDLFTDIYSEEVLDHFANPRNMGEIKDADGVGTVGNPRCGDVMKLYIKVAKKRGGNKGGKQEYIKDIKFQTLGCGAAVATSSMITMMAKGKPLSEAEKITDQSLTEALGGLPPIKFHCSVLAGEGLKKAIADYKSKKSADK